VREGVESFDATRNDAEIEERIVPFARYRTGSSARSPPAKRPTSAASTIPTRRASPPGRPFSTSPSGSPPRATSRRTSVSPAPARPCRGPAGSTACRATATRRRLLRRGPAEGVRARAGTSARHPGRSRCRGEEAGLGRQARLRPPLLRPPGRGRDLPVAASPPTERRRHRPAGRPRGGRGARQLGLLHRLRDHEPRRAHLRPVAVRRPLDRRQCGDGDLRAPGHTARPRRRRVRPGRGAVAREPREHPRLGAGRLEPVRPGRIETARSRLGRRPMDDPLRPVGQRPQVRPAAAAHLHRDREPARSRGLRDLFRTDEEHARPRAASPSGPRSRARSGSRSRRP